MWNGNLRPQLLLCFMFSFSLQLINIKKYEFKNYENLAFPKTMKMSKHCFNYFSVSYFPHHFLSQHLKTNLAFPKTMKMSKHWFNYF